jgi:hypothetical protein
MSVATRFEKLGKLMEKAAYLDFVIEVIRRSDDQKGFEVLPRWAWNGPWAG